MEISAQTGSVLSDNQHSLLNSDPHVPDELNDRAQDNARAICAIADLTGGDWPRIIRESLVGASNQSDDEPQSAGVLLLRDIAEVLKARYSERIGSTELLRALCALEESPWADWRVGKPISTRGVAKLLKPYGIISRRDREQRFYSRTDFDDTFNRYLSDTSK